MGKDIMKTRNILIENPAAQSMLSLIHRFLVCSQFFTRVRRSIV